MAIINEMKEIGKILQEAGKIEQYQQILELQEKSLEMQKRIVELENENRSLAEKLKKKGEVTYSRNAYWSKKNGIEDGPFCSRCWDKSFELIRMHPTINNRNMCPECKNFYARLD